MQFHFVVSLLFSSEVLSTVTKVVYGADDRLEAFLVANNSDLAPLTRAGAIFVYRDWLQLNSDQMSYTLQSGVFTGAFSEADLCNSEPFIGQPNPGWCSGFLVGSSVMVTAGHCISGISDCAGVGIVFDFVMENEHSPPNLLNIPKENVFFCKEIISQTVDELTWTDYSIFSLDRDAADESRLPISLSQAGPLEIGIPLILIGHPYGLPMKLAGGAIVHENIIEQKYFSANLDAFAGNSGSMVVNGLTFEVEGVLVRGSTDFIEQNGCYVTNICPDASGCVEGFEEATKVIAFAHFLPNFEGLLIDHLSEQIIMLPSRHQTEGEEIVVEIELTNTAQEELSYFGKIEEVEIYQQQEQQEGDPQELVTFAGSVYDVIGAIEPNATVIESIYISESWEVPIEIFIYFWDPLWSTNRDFSVVFPSVLMVTDPSLDGLITSNSDGEEEQLTLNIEIAHNLVAIDAFECAEGRRPTAIIILDVVQNAHIDLSLTDLVDLENGDTLLAISPEKQLESLMTSACNDDFGELKRLRDPTFQHDSSLFTEKTKTYHLESEGPQNSKISVHQKPKQILSAISSRHLLQDLPLPLSTYHSHIPNYLVNPGRFYIFCALFSGATGGLLELKITSDTPNFFEHHDEMETSENHLIALVVTASILSVIAVVIIGICCFRKFKHSKFTTRRRYRNVDRSNVEMENRHVEVEMADREDSTDHHESEGLGQHIDVHLEAQQQPTADELQTVRKFAATPVVIAVSSPQLVANAEIPSSASTEEGEPSSLYPKINKKDGMSLNSEGCRDDVVST